MNDFGIKVDCSKATIVGHGAKDGVCHLAYAALEGHSLGEAAHAFFMANKIQNAFADVSGDGIRFHERIHFVEARCFDNGNHLARVNFHEFRTHTVAGAIDGERFCMRRKFRKRGIVNSHEGFSQARIQFQNDLGSHLKVGHRVSARGRKAYATVAQYG